MSLAVLAFFLNSTGCHHTKHTQRPAGRSTTQPSGENATTPTTPESVPGPSPTQVPTPGIGTNPSTINPVPTEITQTKGEKFKAYSGYFVKNTYKPDDKAIYTVLKDKASFDEVFGTAMVMRDRSVRLDNDVFANEFVLAAVHRENGMTKYNISEIAIADDVLTVKYTTTFEASPTAQFASPLIISVAKGKIKKVVFEENQQPVSTVNLGPVTNPLLD